MADRSDYLPSQRLQELAEQADPNLKLEPDAEQACCHLNTLQYLHSTLSAGGGCDCLRRCFKTLQMTSSRTSPFSLASWRCIEGAPLWRQKTSNLHSVRARLGDSDAHWALGGPDSATSWLCIAEKNWNMRLVGVGDQCGELKVIKKTGVTEAHRTRLGDVRRSKAMQR